METYKVNVKGQITIPALLRRKRKLTSGSKIIFFEKENEMILIPYDKDYFRNLIGIGRTKGKAMKSLIKDKIKEKG